MQGAKREGATLLTGGSVPKHLSKGFFVQPTVFTGVKPNMQIWREEVFGPVLAAATFASEEEAICLANDSEYGLAAAVISADAQVRMLQLQHQVLGEAAASGGKSSENFGCITLFLHRADEFEIDDNMVHFSKSPSRLSL